MWARPIGLETKFNKKEAMLQQIACKNKKIQDTLFISNTKCVKNLN